LLPVAEGLTKGDDVVVRYADALVLSPRSLRLLPGTNAFLLLLIGGLRCPGKPEHRVDG
jgi:hypothetical protein